jgi:hypothetical protein
MQVYGNGPTLSKLINHVNDRTNDGDSGRGRAKNGVVLDLAEALALVDKIDKYPAVQSTMSLHPVATQWGMLDALQARTKVAGPNRVVLTGAAKGVLSAFASRVGASVLF